MNNIFLIGFMGSGKSTLGKELAAQLNYTFIESDLWIEKSEQKSIPEIFAQQGESYFRKKERDFLLHAQLLDECVIATGGGMPCFGNNIEIMNQMGTTIWLDVEENILVERLEKEKQTRPLLSGVENLSDKVHSLLEERKLFYQKAKYALRNPTVENIVQILNSICINRKSEIPNRLIGPFHPDSTPGKSSAECREN